MTLLWTMLDVLLAAMLLGLGWAAVATRDLQRGVALFIAFGLLLAIAWARLQAPDLALAEAAIGAGIAGALLLAALRDAHRGTEAPVATASPLRRWAIDLSVVLLAALIGWALLHALSGSDGVRLAALAADNIDETGVSNPVTAVLLNYRAYDTLLELAVVLVAVLGVLALAPARPAFKPAGPVLQSLVRWLVPLLIVTGGYLLWVGAHEPGGAFQAGATLAAAAVLLRLGGRAGAGLPGVRATRWLLILGVGVFVLVGLVVIGDGRGFLQYPGGWDGGLILLIEAAATVSIAAALALAYIGGRPVGWEAATASDPATAERRR